MTYSELKRRVNPAKKSSDALPQLNDSKLDNVSEISVFPSLYFGGFTGVKERRPKHGTRLMSTKFFFFTLRP
jgi:hypothetical protein